MSVVLSGVFDMLLQSANAEDAADTSKANTVGNLSLNEQGSKAKVIFHEIIIREYEVVALCHPAVSSGAAMGVGWKYNMLEPIPFDKFEAERSSQRNPNYQREKTLTRHER